MTAWRIGKFYVLLNGINDTAYFGFVTIQFLLLEPTLRTLLCNEQASISVELTIIIIASQLLWQVFAEGPTGALADIYGRAWAIATSFWCRLFAIVLVVVCYLAQVNCDSAFAMRLTIALAIILAQILMATGEAFLEGSIEAWLRDECEIADPENHEKIVGKTFEYSAIVQNAAILFALTTFLIVWKTSEKGRVPLALSAACLCLVGALISHWLVDQERLIRQANQAARSAEDALSKIRPATRVIMFKIRDAFIMVIRTNEASVRRLITLLILPFPSWVLLSWFFTAFVQPEKIRSTTDVPDAIVWLGVALGVARVCGASTGKVLTSGGDEAKLTDEQKLNNLRKLRLIFERALFVNVFFLFIAALFLLLFRFGKDRFSSLIGMILFLLAIVLAKGSEEVIKLSKNKILASVLPDSNIRATTLSLVSVAQNTFGFIAIFLSSLLAFIVIKGQQPAILIFAVCASLGITGWVIHRKVSRSH